MPKNTDKKDMKKIDENKKLDTNEDFPTQSRQVGSIVGNHEAPGISYFCDIGVGVPLHEVKENPTSIE